MNNLLNNISKIFSNNPKYKNLIKNIKNKNTFNINLNNLHGSSKSLLISQVFSSLNQNILITTNNSQNAQTLYQDIKSFIPKKENIIYFPEWETLPYDSISPFYDIVHHRIEGLNKMLETKKVLVITPMINLIKTIIPKTVFQNEYIKLKINSKSISYKTLIKKLIYLGYNRESKVDSPGIFSVKGSIIDIFPSSCIDPIRVEFYDEYINSIRYFNVNSQISKKEYNQVEILPQRELIFTKNSINRAINIIQKRFQKTNNKNEIINKIKNSNYFPGIENLIPLFYEKESLINYFNSPPIIIYNEIKLLKKMNTSILKQWNELYNQSHKINIIKVKPEEFLSDFNSIYINSKKRLNLSDFNSIEENSYNFNIKSTETLSGNIDLFKKELEKKLKYNYKVIVITEYDARLNYLKSILNQYKPNIIAKKEKNKIELLKNKTSSLIIDSSNLSKGFELIDENIILILDCEMFGNKKNQSYKKLRKVHALPIEGFYDLNIGDLVVHENHGIAIYKGIEKIKAGGKEKDFIVLIYNNKEKLYAPLEQLNLLQKYIGSAKSIQLDKLGSKSWDKKKAKVKKSLEEVAKELVSIYSARKNLKGYSFPKDSQWQIKFESNFPYQETPDQLKAIEEIKKDMESQHPMDRLICGDVGYGKTEVAIRAIFKAVMAGKQVAFLVPTTILCKQHFRNLHERFASYPIKVDILSRNKTGTENKKIIKSLLKGNIDIIIGTHRIVSKDVEFKNLGLVVIDEEQRFGVRHKEALKSIRKLVDVISMSATPIPRTLHMSMVKIRDMSTIETPPENRFAVKTYVTEFNEQIIKDAINREFQRNGQVYFIFNRVKTIKTFSRYINQLIPDAKVCVIHGQMETKDTEIIIHDFINRKYNVLICTSILESGIDIPNVNTILVDRADTFGLAQLYQLKGRVGRSDRKAYCYLFYPKDKVLSEIAQKRLTVIHEYTDLGSGFKVAMKDMEFRGAGNVLGFEQSGSIVNVGFELYCKMLDDAVRKLQNENITEYNEIYVDLKHDMFIPKDYIPDEKQKIEIYKKIISISSMKDLDIVYDEIRDRFGDIPRLILDMLEVSKLRVIARNLNISSIIELKESKLDFSREIMFDFSKSDVKFEKIMNLSKKMLKNIRINPNDRGKMFLKIFTDDVSEKLCSIKQIIDAIV